MLAALAAAVLAASDTPVTGYEDELVQWALKLHDRELEPAPDGKRIEEVLLAIEDVFSKSDPWPSFLNDFHWKTKDPIVRREVLLSPGDVWDAEKVAETERNLRGLTIIAVARVVAVKGRDGGIALLVVTKDRWSLRLEFSYLIVGTVLEYLYVPITELNFLGRNMELAILPYLRRDTLQLGELFVAPRVFGSRVQVAERASLVINRVTPRVEGTEGLLQVAQPLLTLDQKWGFEVTGQWDVRRQRNFRGPDVWELGFPDDMKPSVLVPYIYDQRVLDAYALITRSFGTQWKLNLTGGPGAYLHQYTPTPDSGLTPEVQTWYVANWLPRSESATYLYGAAELFLAEYRSLHNLDSFALTEDVHLGPDVRAGFRWSLPTFPGVSPYLELGGSAIWTLYTHDDLFSVAAAMHARFVTGGGPVYNQHYLFEIVNYSPTFEGGRFVTRLRAQYRINDLDNVRVLLGGNNGLRGAPPEALTGIHDVIGNFEYRTRPFVFATVHLGFVVFYDVGSAFDVKPVFTHTLGMGLRILFPQLNTQVIRVDLGFVLGSNAAFSPSNISSSFGQINTPQFRPTFFEDPI